MRKSINCIVGVFFFVLVFSFFSLESKAEEYSSTYSVSYNSINQSFNGSSAGARYPIWPKFDFGNFSYTENIVSDQIYEVQIYYDLIGSLSNIPRWQFAYLFNLHWGRYSLFYSDQIDLSLLTNGFSNTITYYIYGSELISGNELELDFYLQSDESFSSELSVWGNFSILSVIPLSPDAMDMYDLGYENGYRTGYTDGEINGYSHGFVSGHEMGEEFGYQSGYDKGFLDGVNSIDTDSLYESGYNAGKSIGYDEGYESGYTSGYNSVISRFDSWGADTSEYPIIIHDLVRENPRLTFEVYTSNYAIYENITVDETITTKMYTGYYTASNALTSKIDADIDPNHIYKIQLNNFYTDLEGSGFVNICIGSNVFKQSIRDYEYRDNIYFFVKGDTLGNSLSFTIEGVSSTRYNGDSMYIYFDRWIVYDYGPIGNTQNQIANQTDDLTNGYDSSTGESTSNTFSYNAKSYEQAEANIFTSAKSDLNNFQFYDIGSDSNVLVGLSFVASTMTSIFNAMGGLNGGAGIVLSVLFSVILVSIVIGTYRYFVSSGKTGSSGSKKGGKG